MKTTSASAAPMLPTVIKFDPTTGKPINAQDSRVMETKECGDRDKKRCEVPWREWLGSAAAQSLDSDASDMAAITMVLRSLHRKGLAAAAPVSVSCARATEGTEHSHGKAYRVTVTKAIKKGELEIFPCAPKSAKVVKISSHPDRVPIHVKQIYEDAAVAASTSKQGDGAAATSKGDDKRRQKTRKDNAASSTETKNDDASTTGGASSTKFAAVAANTYYLHPEYKGPQDVTDKSTEADAPEARAWKWTGDESMYPFWTVERVTDTWLRKVNAQSEDGVTLALNVERKEIEFNCVTVGAVQNSSVAITVNVRLPVLTNTRDLTAGTRLLLEATPKPADKRKTESWKTDVGAKAKQLKLDAAAKNKATAATSKANANRGTDVLNI